jgi:hypothetical protein
LPPNERCERCGGAFRCGAAENLFAIPNGPCACAGLALTDALRAELARRYRHCLCVACLRELAARAAEGAAVASGPRG